LRLCCLMPKRVETLPEMVQAATAIERDLQRLEELSRSMSKLPLSTEKNIVRAAHTLQAALQQQEQLAAALGSLGAVMTRMQERQQQAITSLGAHAVAIQAQMTRWTEHMTRFGALGKQAVEVTQALQALPAPHGEGAALDDGSAAPTAEIAEIDRRLASIAQEAKALAASAAEFELVEVARDAGALRQRIESARTRIAGIVANRSQRSN
jgi:hypothetical protein